MNTPYADLLFINGHILTQDSKLPHASQLAVSGNRILAVGEALESYRRKSTEVVDLRGDVLVPGFIDSHLHFLDGGHNLMSVQLGDVDSKASFIRRLSAFAETRDPETWITGGGWNEHNFDRKILPTKDWLDQAAPDHFLLLYRHDGHSAVCNSRTLEISGIDKNTPNPSGGLIVRDDMGNPTGLLKDSAMDLVSTHQPEKSTHDLEALFEAAQNFLLSFGVTSAHDMISDFSQLRFLESMAKARRLRVRLRLFMPLLQWNQLQSELSKGLYQDDWFQFGGLKGFCDGSLGSQTALMLEPYENSTGNFGLYYKDWHSTEHVRQIIEEADAAGFQVAVHAIGDRANRDVLNMFESVIEKNGPRDRRFRIEHAQHVHPADQRRFSDLGIIASVQPSHFIDDIRYGENLLGSRMSYAYPFPSLNESGALLAFGSDWPVARPDPVSTIHASVVHPGGRKDLSLSLESSILAHTSGAAFAGFMDGHVGSLHVGLFSDLVRLDSDFLKLPSFKVSPLNLIKDVYVDGQLITIK